jgi:sortase A
MGAVSALSGRRSDRLAPGRWLLVVGLVLLFVGVGIVGYLGWEYWGSNVVSQGRQRQISDQLRSSWVGQGAGEHGRPANPDVAQGRPLALVRIPRFGAGYVVPVIEGIRTDDLARGLGHFPGTALPGQSGNFALAGHRVTNGEPLRHLPSMRIGDKVIVETSEATYTYALDTDPRRLVVSADETWVLDAVPMAEPAAILPDKGPSVARLTLITCADLFRTTQRMVAFGHLVGTEAKGS